MVEPNNAEISCHILLGGGIASGKSAAGDRFAHRGADVVEADRIGHALLEPGGEAYAAVSDRWPETVVHGRIDRSRLASIVFADQEQLSALEAMTHPAVVSRIGDLRSKHRTLVVEVPLILAVEGAWTRVFVSAPPATRRRRAIRRGGVPLDVDRRMQRQVGRFEWIAWADEIIDNDGTRQHLEEQVDAIWSKLCLAEGSSER